MMNSSKRMTMAQTRLFESKYRERERERETDRETERDREREIERERQTIDDTNYVLLYYIETFFLQQGRK